MYDSEEKDTRFPGARYDSETCRSIEVVREEPIRFHNSAFSVFEARAYLASCKKEVDRTREIR